MPAADRDAVSLRFSRRWRGYDAAEVDAYVRTAARDHRELQIRLEELERVVALALRADRGR
jgi:DivIVA domain-containing protein